MDLPFPAAFTYLALNGFTLLFPLLLSFDRRVQFYRTWPQLAPTLVVVAALFLVWDEWFTRLGVWGFTRTYLSGIYLGSLPLGEWLFFFTVPYACVFIYQVLKVYLPAPAKTSAWRAGSLVVGAFALGVALLYPDRLYTVLTFSGAGTALLVFAWAFPAERHFRFWTAYLLHLLPFFGVNGILTALPVVWYNDAENLGWRLGSVPADDTFYSMLLLLLNVMGYELLMARKQQRRKVLAAT